MPASLVRPTWAVALLLAMLAHGACGIKRHHFGVNWRRGLNAAALAQPDYTIYHHMNSLLHEVEAIVKDNPKTMTMETRTAKDKDYQTKMQVVTVETGGLSTHKKSKDKYKDKVRILLDFGEHSRELISSELGLLFLKTLASPAASAKVVGGGEHGTRLHTLLDGIVFKILPLENERGRDLVEHGALCERKNGRGVDPNRNWSVDWGKKEKDYDPAEENPGREPFSEPEVRIVHELARSFQPHVWLNVHSGMSAMFTPYDHKAEVPAGAQEALRMLQTIHKDVFDSDTNCVVGSGGKSVGYLAHGTATDFMFDVLKVPMPFTWEIYGDFKAAYNDCFKMFNPTSRLELQAVLTVWLKAIIRLVELLPTHSAVPASFKALVPAAPAPAKATSAPPAGRNATARSSPGTRAPPVSKATTKAPAPASKVKEPATAAGTGSSPPGPLPSPPQTYKDVTASALTPVELLFERHQMMLNMSIGFIGLFVVIVLAARSLQKEAPRGEGAH